MGGDDGVLLPKTLDEAEQQLAQVGTVPKERVADKSYHSNETMTGGAGSWVAALYE